MYQIGIVSKDDMLIDPIRHALYENTDHIVEILTDDPLNILRCESLQTQVLIVDSQLIRQATISDLEAHARVSTNISLIILESLDKPPGDGHHDVVDVLIRPVTEDQMHITIQQLIQKLEVLHGLWVIKKKLKERMHQHQIVAKCKSMREVLTLLPRIAASEASVLITGETGTGKELIARAIHYLGARNGEPFVPVDCATIPEHLVENELFGHARGAYTDAGASSGGLLKEANGGTLFLDEVEALPLAVQSKFLRFLQERKYKPLGQSKYLSMNVRVLAATNFDLNQAVEAKTFREDLYFRLNVVPVFIPPLRKRKAEIPILVHHFLQKYGHNSSNLSCPLPEETLQHWLDYHWPGNIRELENKVQEWLTIGTLDLRHKDN
jgi:DNA-binding NtrC family response regulator